MRVFVTGGAGFIGSNLAERLLVEGYGVTVYDDLSAGLRENLRECERHAEFRFVQADLLDLQALEKSIAGHQVVFHMAANSNIPEGRRSSDTDLRLGTLATYNVLEAMRRRSLEQIIFASSSAIYGEATVVPTPEGYGPLLPISLYGASKLACEGLISAFCSNYGMRAWICRFANICGRHGTHGILIDFLDKLAHEPRRLEVLGDGRQAKPYLHVSECVDGMIYIWRNAHEAVNCFNLGCEGATSARRIAELLLETRSASGVDLAFTGGDRGWVGDVPQVRLDCSRLESLGWKARLSSDDAVRRACEELVKEKTATVCRATCKL